MFLEVKFSWNIMVPPIAFYAKSSMLQACVAACLMDKFNTKKATKDDGYFLAVSTLESIGDGKIQDEGDVVFPVVFTGITFKVFRGEILKGLVHKVLKYGVLLKTGPIDNIYLSRSKMPGYHYTQERDPKFIKDEESKIGKDVWIRYIVIGTRWMEAEREFQVLASLEGDHLGPLLVNSGL